MREGIWIHYWRAKHKLSIISFAFDIRTKTILSPCPPFPTCTRAIAAMDTIHHATASDPSEGVLSGSWATSTSSDAFNSKTATMDIASFSTKIHWPPLAAVRPRNNNNNIFTINPNTNGIGVVRMQWLSWNTGGNGTFFCWWQWLYWYSSLPCRRYGIRLSCRQTTL